MELEADEIQDVVTSDETALLLGLHSTQSLPTIDDAARIVDPNLGRQPVFAAWVDDQVRRHFGPIGADTLPDLLRAPLVRRPKAGDEVHRVLCIGRRSLAQAERTAEALIGFVQAGFVVHAADSGLLAEADADQNVRPVTLSIDSPLASLIEAESPIQSPADLEQLVERLSPDLILCQDFLDRAPELDDWLAAFGRASEAGASLLFSEDAGHGPVDVTNEMQQIGQRIWDLMPERYTRVDGQNEDEICHWHEAFEKRPVGAANQLMQRIRSTFPLELFASFGFLAAAFVDSAIARNFDPKAARDQRFLRQIADIDDRKIEAGHAPALRFVALIDTEAATQRESETENAATRT